MSEWMSMHAYGDTIDWETKVLGAKSNERCVRRIICCTKEKKAIAFNFQAAFADRPGPGPTGSFIPITRKYYPLHDYVLKVAGRERSHAMFVGTEKDCEPRFWL